MNRVLIILTVILEGCVEPFEPRGLAPNPIYVIDGMVSDEFKAHEIQFTQTSSASFGTPQFIPVTDAEILIMEGNNTTFTLAEISPGQYRTPVFAGQPGVNYQLRAITSDGEVIESSPITLKATPEIESIDAKFISEDNRGIEIRISSEEQDIETLYLRWTYEETYEYVSILPNRFEWLGGNEVEEIDLRESDTCWVNDSSNKVFIFSGLRLNTQSARDIPIRFIEEFSEELQNRYSIEISQYALDSEGYSYWELLRKLNTGQGSTFDTQPGKIIGNLTSNRGSNVLGFFDASEVKTSRLTFRTNDFINDGLMLDQSRLSLCESSTEIVPAFRIGEYMEQFGDQVNIVGTFAGGSVFLVGSKQCSDCRIFGTNVKPDYWP